MYHKVRNTLTGLGFVFAAFCGSLLFGEPVPAEPAVAPMSAEAQEAAAALALVQTAVTLAQAGLTAEAAAQAEAQALEAARHAARRAPSRSRSWGSPPCWFSSWVEP